MCTEIATKCFKSNNIEKHEARGDVNCSLLVQKVLDNFRKKLHTLYFTDQQCSKN